MDATAQALARRLAEHPLWTWMPGMSPLLWAPGMHSHLHHEVRIILGRRVLWSDGEGVPDLDDPATQGCLLAMLAEAMDVAVAEAAAFACSTEPLPERWGPTLAGDILDAWEAGR